MRASDAFLGPIGPVSTFEALLEVPPVVLLSMGDG